MGGWSAMTAFGLFLALWIVAATVALVVQRLRASPQRGLAAKLGANSAAWYGMVVAHLGIAVFIVGVTMVRSYGIEQNVTLDNGQSVTAGGYEFTFRGVTPVTGPNFTGLAGIVEMRRDGKLLDTLRPEKRVYNASGMAMTEAAIDAGIFGDRYVSLGEPISDQGVAGAWALRVYVKPFVDWIWGGCFLMALGGFIAMTDRRYRLKVRQKVAGLAGAAPAA
jgi:cytochrome c-type biogenesis protein CcmF